jgi:hypothetical protein
MRACALCAAFKYGLTPSLEGHAMTTFSEETTKKRHVSSRVSVLVAGIEHGMRFDTDQVMALKLDVSRVALLRIAYKRGHFASLTHIRGEVTRELVHKYLERQKDAMRIVRLVIASRLCRDTGVIVIKQISTFVMNP